MSISTQTAVIATEGGGVITEVNITAIGDANVAAALALMAKLIEATNTFPRVQLADAVIGVTPMRQVAPRSGVAS